MSDQQLRRTTAQDTAAKQQLKKVSVLLLAGGR
jgi:hypothetical protein